MYEDYAMPLPDPDLYLKRLQMERPKALDLDYLNKLIYAHHTHIPFEDLDSSLLKVPVSLSIPALYDKVVLKERGGYCFELNGLFTQLLMDLGFKARSIFCRIVRNHTDVPPCRHRGILVEIDQQFYFCDVGYGGPMPAGAVPVQDGYEEVIHGEPFQIQKADAEWWTLSRTTSEGLRENVIQFTTMAQTAVEFMAINYFCSTHPDSVFGRKILVNLRTETGNLGMDDNEFIKNEHGTRTVIPITSEEHCKEILKDYFNIKI